MNKGKVWLVGAGPGDIGLMTLKAIEVISSADLIVYDALIGDAILPALPKDIERISVGKRAGKHTMSQDQIDRLLLEEAKKGKKVVRLKGGDPFLFGRGGEEIELLAEEGIDYEIVPGVTSPIAVPAYNGIPVTHRDHASSLHIVTGHKRKNADGSDADSDGIDYEALVRTKGTLVFLMGVSRIHDICSGLLAGGAEPDMPAAVLTKGTTARQKRVIATVATLEKEVMRQKIETPAIIMAGRVCELAEDFAWYEKLPLAGWRITVTRPRESSSKMAKKLRDLGAEVLEMPSIETVPLEDQEGLHRALKNMSGYDWIVFTSPAGVRIFFDEMKASKTDVRILTGIKVAAIGSGTEKEVEKHGIFVDFVPSLYDGETLGRELAEQICHGDRILIPRAAIGGRDLTDILTKAGAVVDDVPIYDTVPAKNEAIDERHLWEAGEIDCTVFTSASTVRGFADRTKGLDYSKVKAACIGKQTKECADSYGMKTYVADRATIDSLTELVVKMKGE